MTTQIELQNVTFQYPKNDEPTLKQIHLTLNQGDQLAIVGQNGSGKSTLAKLMNGLLHPTSGSAHIHSLDSQSIPTAEISKYVGYVFQDPDEQIFHATVAKEVLFGLKLRKFPKAQIKLQLNHALIMTGLDRYRDMNPFDLPPATRKFVAIATVLALNPDVIIFDEPTAGQDTFGNQLLSKIIRTQKKMGKTVIVISHDMDFVSNNFNDILVMTHQRILSRDTAKAVFWDEKLINEAHIEQPSICGICKHLGIMSKPITLKEATVAIKSELFS
ncbi:energy-coupling factor ABC transporter ATP-binding protein [Levilactobacillus huananensis]|uniref:energy-coupling factor ABC transporter ATP-binding protein n=1 Tax=Levilactobacillus huananensis TaxID=2486019 RepID=UPI000F787246|nr:ABC transporter ATP-binding protein [Levilactobacillus huananensis]